VFPYLEKGELIQEAFFVIVKPVEEDCVDEDESAKDDCTDRCRDGCTTLISVVFKYNCPFSSEEKISWVSFHATATPDNFVPLISSASSGPVSPA